MKKKVLLKSVSFVLSASTLMSSFSIAPNYAKSKLTLSKEAKIGIGVSAGVLGAGLITGLLLLLTREHKGENVDKDKNEPDSENSTHRKDDVKLDPNVTEKKNLWEILESDLDEDAAGWVKKAYPILAEKLSKFVLGDETSELKITFEFSDKKIHHREFKLYPKNIHETTDSLHVMGQQLLVYKNMSGSKSIPKIQIQISEKSFGGTKTFSSDSATPDDYSTPEGIQESLARRAEDFKKLDKSEKKSRFENNWGQLCYFLGSQENIDWVEENYPEWKERMSKGDPLSPDYPTICGTNLESFSLISIAYSLLSAKAERYNPADEENNELIVGMPDILEPEYKATGTPEEIKAARLKKMKIFHEDILQCAHRLINDGVLIGKKIGFLNAGDNVDPAGFLPNRGSVLEEYLANMTTLIRDLSYKAFRKGHPDCIGGGFYDTRENFPAVVGFDSNKGGAWGRLTGKGRDFYHARGIMSKKVRLMRPLGKSVWNPRGGIFDLYNFNVGKDGLYSKEFCVLTIAGLEDRTFYEDARLLMCGGDGHTADEYRAEWTKITMKQCEFILRSFIKAGVKVPFLCPFGAGAFGGSSKIVAECFRKLLIEQGYADYFDMVVFPILYGSDLITGESSIHVFNNAFKKDYKPQFVELS